jgi:hypothetical protein
MTPASPSLSICLAWVRQSSIASSKDSSARVLLREEAVTVVVVTATACSSFFLRPRFLRPCLRSTLLMLARIFSGTSACPGWSASQRASTSALLLPASHSGCSPNTLRK